MSSAKNRLKKGKGLIACFHTCKSGWPNSHTDYFVTKSSGKSLKKHQQTRRREPTNRHCIICPLPLELTHHSNELQCLHDWATEMQPKTNHNYLFVVLLWANMNIIQKHTHDVWSSSKFHNRSLVSRGYWIPLSWTSSFSLTHARAHTHTHTHTHTRTHANCNSGSLQTTPSLGQFASPACCEPGRCLFS